MPLRFGSEWRDQWRHLPSNLTLGVLRCSDAARDTTSKRSSPSVAIPRQKSACLPHSAFRRSSRARVTCEILWFSRAARFILHEPSIFASQWPRSTRAIKIGLFVRGWTMPVDPDNLSRASSAPGHTLNPFCRGLAWSCRSGSLRLTVHPKTTSAPGC